MCALQSGSRARLLLVVAELVGPVIDFFFFHHSVEKLVIRIELALWQSAGVHSPLGSLRRFMPLWLEPSLLHRFLVNLLVPLNSEDLHGHPHLELAAPMLQNALPIFPILLDLLKEVAAFAFLGLLIAGSTAAAIVLAARLITNSKPYGKHAATLEPSCALA